MKPSAHIVFGAAFVHLHELDIRILPQLGRIGPVALPERLREIASLISEPAKPDYFYVRNRKGFERKNFQFISSRCLVMGAGHWFTTISLE